MPPTRLQYLLEKYLDGTATPEELREYNDWYEAQGQGGDNAAFTPAELKAVYTQIEAGIGRRQIVKLRKRWLVAASVAALLAVSGGYYYMQHKAAPVAQSAIAQASIPVAIDSVIVNHAQAVFSTRLPDGSLVRLYKGSELHFNKGFGKTDRTLQLKGSGYFEATHNPSLPFTVSTRGVSTTALATAFTIRTCNDRVSVLLHNGRVKVQAQEKILYLQPGELALADGNTGLRRAQPDSSTVVAKAAIIKDFGALRGVEASFDQAPLDSVLDELAKAYHVRIRVQPAAISNIMFSGMVRPTDSLSQVLNRIATLNDLKITTTATGYRIEKNH